MIFHENRLLDDSHEISFLYLFQKLGKMSQNLSSAAVVIGTLRVKLAICNIGKIKCTENITSKGSMNQSLYGKII